MVAANWSSRRHRRGVADVPARDGRRRRAGGGGPAARSSSPTRRARSALSGACHASGVRRSSVSPARRCLRRDPGRVCKSINRIVSTAPLQCSARSRPSPRRSGTVRTAARCSRTHHPDCQGDQLYARPAWGGVGGPLPCASAHHAARGPSCPGLRAPKLAEASDRRPRPRSAIVGGMVHRVANGDGGAAGTTSGGEGSDVARVRRLAPTRPPRNGRISTFGATALT